MHYTPSIDRGYKTGTRLALISGDTYKNFPLLPSIGYFYPSYLEVIHRVTHQALNAYPRTLAVRVDLRFPPGYDPYATGVMSRFIASLQSQIDCSLQRSSSPHKCRVRYIRVVEQGGRNQGWHFHAVLFFNAQAYRALGVLGNYEADNLANRIRKAWSRALYLDSAEGFNLVHFPSNGCYLLEEGKRETYFPTLINLMRRLSYMAKQRTKVHGDHRRVIEHSRV